MAEASKKARGAGWWALVGCGALATLVLLFCGGGWMLAALPFAGLFDDPGFGPPSYAPPPGGAVARGPVLPPPPGPIEPAGVSPAEEAAEAVTPLIRQVEFEVTSATGAAPLAVGSRCPFDVERVPQPDGSYRCRARVECEGALLYGGERSGFFDCNMPDDPPGTVSGEDDQTSAADSDAAFSVDSLRQTVTIRDDETGTLGVLRIEGRILSVQ